jgi:hypothetical protein
MDSSTEPPLYYVAANKQKELFREERCPPSGIHKPYGNSSRIVWENAGKTNETLVEIIL